MPRITQLIQPIVYTGPSLALASAAFSTRLLQVARVSPNGKGWVTYRPGALHASFWTLEPGVSYVIFSSEVNYLIPDGEVVPSLVPLSSLAPEVLTLINSKVSTTGLDQLIASKVISAGGTSQLTSFTFATLGTDLLLWLDARDESTFTLDDATQQVIAWRSKGSRSLAFSSPDPAHLPLPVRSSNAVQFKGSPLFNNDGSFALTDFLYLFILTPPAQAQSAIVADFGFYNSSLRLADGNYLGYNRPADGRAVSVPSTPTRTLVAFSRQADGNIARISLNGGDPQRLFDTSPQATIPGQILLGGNRRSDATVEYALTSSVELVVAIGAMSMPLLRKCEGLCRRDWGITLPDTHPYATVDPVVEDIVTGINAPFVV